MKKVAVWGPNRWCNFGDDLQSVVFALHLKSLGYEPVVYMLDSAVADEHDIAVANTIDELLEGASLCVVAGGAMLTPVLPPARIIVPMRRRWQRDITELHRGAKKHNCKVCAISTGGDGKTRNRWFWYDLPRNLFFPSEYFINGTVRLKGDIAQMRSFGKEFGYFPDCLFSIQKFIDLPSSTKEKRDPGAPLKLGFNLQKRQIPDSFIKELHDYAAAHDDIEFHIATTHMDRAIKDYDTTYEYLPEKDTHNLKFVHYTTPSQLLQFVADMDVFIASKLHLGFLGILVGTPFVSYNGMGKARSFLKSLKADAAIAPDNASFESLVAPGGLLRKPTEELMKLYDMDVLQGMIDESWGHYEFCTKITKEHA